MYILIYNSKDPFSIELPETFKQINIRDFYSTKDESNYLYNNNKDEFFLNAISESLDNLSFSSTMAVIIDKNLGISGWSRAISLAGHIACTNYSQCAINNVPIILTDWTNINLEDPSLKYAPINNLFQTEGFYFRKYEDLFSKKADSLTGELKYLIDIEIKRLKSIDFKNISIKSVYDNSHQATNEWGAMQLASNFGIFDLIKFTYPKHLYFKYLSRFINQKHVPPDISLNNMFNKILLIDDNADCGWVELLGNIHNCQVDKITSTETLNIWQNVTPVKFDNYELIYLDLYLEKGSSNSARALSALKFIKLKFPHIPVIIFTASDKAWNLDEILEKGADAMYIKESPLYYRDEEYSLKNYEDFKRIVRYVHDKYKILRPYWLLIRKIVSHSSFQTIENSPRKIRDRIKERLRMFYGLLKKGYEQWDYDKQTFFYDDYELAFMTLWSVLNEIQECKFVKRPLSFPIEDSNGVIYHSHPNGTHNIRQSFVKWHYKVDMSPYINYYIELDTAGVPIETRNSATNMNSGFFDFKFYSNFRQIAIKDPITKVWVEQAPFFETINTFENHKFLKIFEEKIILQIAFLIEKMNPTIKTNYYASLIDLNKIRNSLYLTHGSNIDPGFYHSTEEQKRSVTTITPQNKIMDLFNLVLFLLTGDENLQLIL